MIRVVVCDDHAVVRAGLGQLIATFEDVEVTGTAGSAEEVLALVAGPGADVVLMDLEMPGTDGIAATRLIVATENAPRVLVLTMHPEDEYLVPLLEAGASGYLVKSAADRDLVDAVRAVARGDLYVRPSAARVLARPPILQSERLIFHPFTADDYALLADLHSDPEVQRTLGGMWDDATIRARLDHFVQEQAERGHSKWKVFTREGDFIGRAGVSFFERTGELELGYTLARRFWGQGYASEAAAALLKQEQWSDDELEALRAQIEHVRKQRRQS